MPRNGRMRGLPGIFRKEDPTETPLCSDVVPYEASTRREGLLPFAVLCHSRQDLTTPPLCLALPNFLPFK